MDLSAVVFFGLRPAFLGEKGLPPASALPRGVFLLARDGLAAPLSGALPRTPPCLRRPKGRGRGPSESRAFVEGYRPPHPNEIQRLTREGSRYVSVSSPACLPSARWREV